jgi:hypothetical protein
MQSQKDLINRKANTAICKAQEFLLNSQDYDGFWRDYSLPPGSSEAWITACVGWVLSSSSQHHEFASSLKKGVEALNSIRGPYGWGYNRKTAPDADSTAWTFRFFAKMVNQLEVDAEGILKLYLNQNGSARTFLDTNRFGSWATEHPDVTPVVGIALAEVGADLLLVDRIRQACINTWRANGNWPSFWWSVDSYSIARNLEFLSTSGGIPNDISRGVWEKLIRLNRPSSPFEAANNLISALTLGKAQTDFSNHQIIVLLEWQFNDNSWPSSPVLRVPDQNGHTNSNIYEDPMRIMSTLMVTYALNLYIGPEVAKLS